MIQLVYWRDPLMAGVGAGVCAGGVACGVACGVAVCLYCSHGVAFDRMDFC